MPFLLADRGSLHFDVCGVPNAATLLFVNALGTDLRIWDHVVEDLAHQAQCIRYDMRGHGLSWGTASETIEGNVADALYVLDTVAPGRVIVVGLSVGGVIAQALTALHPKRVSALILCCTGGRIGTPELWEARLAALQNSSLEDLSLQIVQRWFSPSFSAEHAAAMAGFRAMLSSTRKASYEALCRLLRDTDVSALQEEIICPTQCFAGTEDVAAPPESMKTSLRGIVGARFTTLLGCGHLPCVERPHALSELIKDFISENSCVTAG
jgi:3-oxoadipate enol-lactonase